jgi:hypothetical protein
VLGLAQPTITRQPASLAVRLGSNATFGVTAAGAVPLAYQWQLDGRELTDATNASRVVSNVTLADLGSYTVAVRDAHGQAVSQPAWLKLARWTELVAFDASNAWLSTPTASPGSNGSENVSASRHRAR